MKKFIQSTFTAIALGLLLSIPYAAPLEAAARIDDSLNLMTIAKLPACNVNNSGSSAAVSDYAGSISWGSAVGTGGGTGVARVYCNGASWTVFAGGGGGSSPTTQQNFVLAAPNTTANGNYATGCLSSPAALNSTFSNHSCLNFDDHWTTTPTGNTPIAALSTSWYAGYYRCNGGTGGNANCIQQLSGSMNYPFSAWCYNNSTGGCMTSFFFDYPLGDATNAANVTTNTTQTVADGSLDLGTAFYPNSTIIANTGCVSLNSFTDCSVLNWIGGGITTGGLTNLNTDNNLPNNLTALIPAAGGLFQARMRMDGGLAAGMWDGIECDAVDNINGIGGDRSNANFEWGYNNGGATNPLQGFGMGLNNTADQPNNVVITTGDDGVGPGDATHWHTYAIEWTGNATHQWNWYIDGVSQPVGNLNTHNETNLPTVGFTCAVTNNMTNHGEDSFHSTWDRNNPGGPFHQYISDAQVYKKPGTSP